VFPFGPCSNCLKTGKDCTFAWLRSQPKIVRTRRTSGASGPYSKRPQLEIGKSQFGSADVRSNGPESHTYPTPRPTPSAKTFRRRHSQGPPDAWVGPSARRTSSQFSFDDDYGGRSRFAAENDDFCTNTSDGYEETFSVAGFDHENPFLEVEPASSKDFTYESISEGTKNSISSSSPSFLGVSRAGEQRTGYAPTYNERQMHQKTNISSFSIPERLTMFTNKSLVTESLMKVYHDSFENALSCWLTERTCPYGTRTLPPTGFRTVDQTMLREWGPDWSNRMCRQVFALDRVSASIRREPLTRSEDKAASNALNLAIMSFATQWSQSSERSRTKFHSFNTCSGSQEESTEPFTADREGEHEDSPPPIMDFDRLLQESLWAQARAAIQGATHIESFRVVFAHIIFALTQKPLSVDHHSTLPPFSTRRSENEDTKLMNELDGIIESDGPPIFLEQGLRHIHVLRSKLHGLKARPDKANDGNTASDPAKADSVSSSFTQENWKTVDLLYWLGVMFDTLSAAMHKRPLVVSDEDSDINPDISPSAPKPTGSVFSSNHSTRKSSSNLWDSFFFRAQRPRSRSMPVRWPCSYDVAATT
jgi:hypothetical protein